MKSLFYGENTHLLNGHLLYVDIGIASMRQFQCLPTKYVTEIKEPYIEIYTKQVSCPLHGCKKLVPKIYSQNYQ